MTSTTPITLGFFAPFDVQSGLGTGAREICRTLQQAPVELTLSNYNIGHEAHPREAFSAPEPTLPIDQPMPVDIAGVFHNADCFDRFARHTGTAYLRASRDRVAHWG
jgi:hypothetical protein